VPATAVATAVAVTAGAGANVEATTGSAAPETGIRQVPATAVATAVAVTAGAGANVEATTGSAAPETGIRQVPATAVATAVAVTAGAGANVEATTGSAAPETGIRQVPATAVAPPRQWRPTESELGILRVLWTRGPSTVREVHATLAGATGYTTVLKLMQIMAEKGLVERDEDQRAHVYRARLAQEHTQRQLLGDLLERAFGGSATGMVMQLLSSRAASADEIAELRKLLDDYEGRRA